MKLISILDTAEEVSELEGQSEKIGQSSTET